MIESDSDLRRAGMSAVPKVCESAIPLRFFLVLILEERDANKRSHHSCVCIVWVAAAREIAAFAFVVGTRPLQRGAAGKEGCGLRARSTARAGRPLEPEGPLARAAVSIKARERAAGVRLASVAAGRAGPREWWEHLALSRADFFRKAAKQR